MTFLRRGSVAAAGAMAMALVSAAPADAKDRPPPAACASAYEDGVMLQHAGRPREAQARLLECARSSCGSSLQKKCASGAEQARSDVAWIAPVVTDAGGTPIVDAQVKLDDQALTSRVDGRAVPVDPGLHEVSVEARVGAWPGRVVTTKRKVVVVQGQRGPLSIALPALPEDAASTEPPPVAPASPTSPTPVPVTAPAEPPSAPSLTAHTRGHGPSAWPFVVGSVGLLGLGAGALLTYWGKTDDDALASCSPSCPRSSIDHIRRLYLAADVSFGVGGAALGVAALLLVTGRASSHEAAPTTATTFDVRPTRSGAVASFQGTF